jgi:hypothetical protein
MARGDLRTWNLNQVIVLVNGIPVDGWDESDAVSFAPTDDLSSMTVGADGEVTRNISNDRTGSITFNLMQTSRGNDIFNALMQLSKTVATGDVFSIFIDNINSGEKMVAPKCWIKREPDLKMGKSASANTWVCDSSSVTTNRGGALR